MAFIEAFLASAALVGIAELGDKTQIAILSLSGKYNRRAPLLLGVLCGFALVDGVAVIFGSTISSLVPERTIAVFASLAFIIFGIYFLMEKEEESKETRHKSLFLSSFLLITLMELGDKTQLLTITLSARYASALGVFLGALSALMALSIVAVLLGAALSERIPQDKFKKFSAVLFIALGVLGLIGY